MNEHAQAPRLEARTLRWILPIILICGLWSVGFPALDQYNVTWDEALGDFFFGERYLSYFTTFDSAYLDFEAEVYPTERTPDLGLSPFRNRPWEYYPVANVLAAATSEMLSRQLGWIDPFDGFHALNLLLAAGLMWVLFRFLAPRFGLIAATAAIGFLFTAPRIVCHLMANIKDFPLMVFFTLTCLAFLAAYEAGSARGLVAVGALWGLTLGIKANALFLPGIVVTVVLLGKLPDAWKGRRWQLFLVALAGGFTGLGAVFLSWPYLWADPLGRAWQHLEYIGFRSNYTRPESLAPAFEAVVLTTPLPFLVCSLVGMVYCSLRVRKGDRAAVLLLAWPVVVLGRFLLPQSVNFDGVRHFLELFPALAALAGIGLAWLGQLLVGQLLVGQMLVGQMLVGQMLASRMPERLDAERFHHRLKAVGLLLVLLPGAWATLSSHPFQIAWWNSLAGGPAGAYAGNLPQAGDYWGMSYRQGLRWLNENAEPDALLAVPVIEHAVRLVAPERLRKDILLLPITSPLSPQIPKDRLERTLEAARSRPLYVMFVERRDWMNVLMVDCLERLQPEVVWGLEGAPVLRIYRYIPPAQP